MPSSASRSRKEKSTLRVSWMPLKSESGHSLRGYSFWVGAVFCVARACGLVFALSMMIVRVSKFKISVHVK